MSQTHWRLTLTDPKIRMLLPESETRRGTDISSFAEFLSRAITHKEALGESPGFLFHPGDENEK